MDKYQFLKEEERLDYTLQTLNEEILNYIEKRKDGSYILYFGPTTQIISKEDVENGFYDLYPIINEK